ncbi:MAG TPA: hypothetical protein VJL87_07740, partial [Bdellovibrionota bacterium]|nr:hypothetical protein [Bdellovibrionota bacterium]
MKRFLSIFICGLILGVGIAKAQDASTTSAEVRGPWMNIISTETGFVPPVSSENRGASLWQSTNILVGYRINEDYSVSFLQGISNSFFDTGVSENGAYSLEHTILGISRKNLGEIAGADLSARLGALIPTGRLTEDENKMGLLGSLEPSIKGSKT